MIKRAVTELEILKLIKDGVKEVVLHENDILTPLAIDRIKSSDLIIRKISGAAVRDELKKIVIGCDHTGLTAKKEIIEQLKKKSFDVLDIGTYNETAVDYPDIAFSVASRVAKKEFPWGIIIDATGIPSAITANKIPGIRAATCYNEFSAKSSREHNDANILVLGAKSLEIENLKNIVDVWLESKFFGDRHQRRLDKIKSIEEKYSKKI
jgi:ribose 5-phosphate isomerase B